MIVLGGTEMMMRGFVFGFALALWLVFGSALVVWLLS